MKASAWASITVPPIFGAQSGMSQFEDIHYSFWASIPEGQTRTICGSNDTPALASHIYTGT
jgi:hypothetical protein